MFSIKKISQKKRDKLYVRSQNNFLDTSSLLYVLIISFYD